MPRPQSVETARQSLTQESFPTPEGVEKVTFLAEEFTSICPRSGQPDFSSIEIEYCPDERCLESKSLKFYLWAFRDEGAFCETLAAQIARDVRDAIDPLWVSVTIRQNPRGGIGLVATASFHRQIVISGAKTGWETK